MNFVTKTLVAATLAAGFAAAASAAVFSPVSATASSSFSGFGANYAIDGLANTDWAANGTGAGSSIFFDLGGSWNITTTFVTDRVTSGGGNPSFSYGVSDFTTAYTLEFFSDAAGTISVGSFSYVGLPVPVSPSSPADFLTTTGFSVTAASARYTVNATGISNNPGLSEISFEGTAVPEASTWMLMIAGFGMVGVASRRRKTVVAA